ncbi:hypothetical protein L6R52_21730, partial [Myxococcota bacterium]|nr:hypothetical protein [Myxococcota bacterium]
VLAAIVVIAAIVVGLVLAVPATALAEELAEVRVATVPAVVPATARAEVRVIRDAVERAARGRGALSVLSEEESFAVSTELTDQVLDCGGDTACLAAALARIGVPLGLVAVLNLELEPPLLGLVLIDGRRAHVLGEDIGPWSAERDGALTDVVRRRAAKLFDAAGFVERARLTVVTDPPGALVRVSRAEGAVVAELRADGLALAPGRHRIDVELAGHVPVSRELELAAGADVVERIELEREGSIVSSPWLWIAVGAAIAGGAAAALVLTRSTERVACVPLAGVDCE